MIFQEIQAFDESELLKEMLAAEEGTVFVLGQKAIRKYEPRVDDEVEITLVEIRKVKA